MAIRVLIVEDSPFMQRLLTALIGAHDDLKVVGVAEDPIAARERIKALRPDVITLDVEMPRMDGITFLERLMRLRPMPVVMVSSLTESNAEVTLRALELGAVDFVTKPRGDGGAELDHFGAELVEKLREAAGAEIQPAPAPPARSTGGAIAFRSNSLIAVGGSTGGTEAIRELLVPMPANAPPILIVQHMPEMFTRLFARRLDDLCAIKVSEAVHGEPLEAGHAYIAPGGWHMTVGGKKGAPGLLLDQTEPVNRHRPSVDVLFRSAARAFGARAVGVILTGMGRDGAEGLGDMKRAGATTFAQDKASCVVFGMPKAAIDAGHADHVAPADQLAGRVIEALRLDSRQAGGTATR
jgi:two-component system, chemotaxis family, protein-glutamate methylesterase/glutaminase